MYVGRIVRETSDTSRVTVDFTQWLDTGETVTQITNQKVIQGAYGWNTTRPPFTQPLTPYDPTPLLITSLVTISNGSQVQMFLDAGTPAMAYTVQFVAWGSSGRKKTIEVGVQLTGVAPSPPSNVTPPANLPGDLPLLGGTMLGPLYLFEDPLSPTEAANKDYVDTLFGTTVQDVAAEAIARATADAVIQATIGSEITRATGVEAAIIGATKDVVAGAGLGGGTIALGGTTNVSGTLTANWNGGTVSALGTGLAINSGTLNPNYRAGTLTTFNNGLTLTSGTLSPDWNGGAVVAIGAGVTLSGGTLSAGGSGGTVTQVNAGAGLSGGPITASGTLKADWNGVLVGAIASSLTIDAGHTLGVVFPAVEWTAGAVTTVGAGLAISGGTLVSQSTAVFNTTSDVSGTRAYGVTYTNSTGRAMFVSAGGTSSGGSATAALTIASIVTQVVYQNSTSQAVYVCGMIPAGATYSIAVTGSASLDHWTETY